MKKKTLSKDRVINPAIFSTGAKRSNECKGYRYDLISPIAMKRLARRHRVGQEKGYLDMNWERGMPIMGEHGLLNHVKAHLQAYEGGDRSDDHLAAALWGMAAMCHSEELWPELNMNLRGPGCTPPTIKEVKNVRRKSNRR